MKNELFDDLQARVRELDALIKEKEKQIAEAPPGYLNVNQPGDRPAQYYHVYYDEDRKKMRSYLRKKDALPLICALAQKDYDLKTIQAARQEKVAIESCLKLAPSIAPEELYDQLLPARKDVVHPLVEPYDVFVAKWQGQRYDGNPVPIAKPFQTARGEIVRSKSEVEIANYLYYHHIPYLYECPLVLFDGGRKVTYYPDFTILDPVTREVVYLEHLGRMDDPDYVNDNLEKRRVYEENGIFEGEKIFFTWETYDHPLTRRQVQRIVKHAIHVPESVG